MSFLQREYEVLNEMLRNTPDAAADYSSVYIAQQAIAWAMDPDGFASPSRLLHKNRGEDCGTVGTGIVLEGDPTKLPAAPAQEISQPR